MDIQKRRASCHKLARSAADATNAADQRAGVSAASGCRMVVFFTSMRSGIGDIYRSPGRSLAEPFPAPVALGDLDSDDYACNCAPSADLGTIMFSPNL